MLIFWQVLAIVVLVKCTKCLTNTFNRALFEMKLVPRLVADGIEPDDDDDDDVYYNKQLIFFWEGW